MFGADYFAESYFGQGFGGLSTPGQAVCLSVSIPKKGIIAPVYTVATTSGIGLLAFESFASCDSIGQPVGNAVQQMFISGVPAGSTLIVDCARHEVRLIDANGVQVDATPLFVLTGVGLEWLEVADCDTGIGCFCVRAAAPLGLGTHATVKIETQEREG